MHCIDARAVIACTNTSTLTLEHNGAATDTGPKDRSPDDGALSASTVLSLQRIPLAVGIHDCAAAVVTSAVQSTDLHLANMHIV